MITYGASVHTFSGETLYYVVSMVSNLIQMKPLYYVHCSLHVWSTRDWQDHIFQKCITNTNGQTCWNDEFATSTGIPFVCTEGRIADFKSKSIEWEKRTIKLCSSPLISF